MLTTLACANRVRKTFERHASVPAQAYAGPTLAGCSLDAAAHAITLRFNSSLLRGGGARGSETKRRAVASNPS